MIHFKPYIELFSVAGSVDGEVVCILVSQISSVSASWGAVTISPAVVPQPE